MSTEVRTFDFTIPNTATQANPATLPMLFPPRDVERIDIVFPPGPMGAVGVAIGAAGQPIIPYNAGAWIIADDDTISWPIIGAHNSGSWEAFGYNLGHFQHTVHIRFLLTTLDDPGETSSLQIASNVDLSSTPSGG